MSNLVYRLHSAQFLTWMWQLFVKNSQLLRTQNLSLIPWPKLCILSCWFRIWSYFLPEMPHFAKKCNFLSPKILKSKSTFSSIFNFTIFINFSWMKSFVIEKKKRKKNSSGCDCQFFQISFYEDFKFFQIYNRKLDF